MPYFRLVRATRKRCARHNYLRTVVGWPVQMDRLDDTVGRYRTIFVETGTQGVAVSGGRVLPDR
jgi:hypothetical protein